MHKKLSSFMGIENVDSIRQYKQYEVGTKKKRPYLLYSGFSLMTQAQLHTHIM